MKAKYETPGRPFDDTRLLESVYQGSRVRIHHCRTWGKDSVQYGVFYQLTGIVLLSKPLYSAQGVFAVTAAMQVIITVSKPRNYGTET
jgi:triphosphoribosyl-dephospho-CoA synthetase